MTGNGYKISHTAAVNAAIEAVTTATDEAYRMATAVGREPSPELLLSIAHGWAAVAAQLPVVVDEWRDPAAVPVVPGPVEYEADATAVMTRVDPGQGGAPAGMCYCGRVEGAHMFGAYGCENS